MSRTGRRSPSSSTSTTSAPRAPCSPASTCSETPANASTRSSSKAREAGKRILPIGAGWALSKINITDGWLVNTKLLNGCYDVGDRYFEAAYPAADRPCVVLAQAGMQIAELNAYLELIPQDVAKKRALKAAGIGNGQTIAGAVSGNTHGSQINFGAMPDFVVGLHIATGSGRTLWIEKASKPVLNQDFAAKIGAELIRDDDIFNAAVVSFGTFGIIAAVAVETAPIYQLDFPPIGDIHHDDLKAKLTGFGDADPADLYHYEFIFDPHTPQADGDGGGRAAGALRAGPPDAAAALDRPRQERLRARRQHPARPAALLRLLPPRFTTGIQFKQYRKLALLNGVRGTPGQLYTSSIYYLEGYTESAFGVSVKDAPETIDICSAGGAGDAAALDQPGQARPPLGSDVGLHPARAEDGGLRGRPHQRRHVPRVRAAAGRGVPEGGDPLHDALVEELGDRPAEARLHVRRGRRSRAGRRRGGRSSAATRR